MDPRRGDFSLILLDSNWHSRSFATRVRGMNRRAFLKTGAVCATLASSGFAPGQEAKRRIRIGFLGASHSHAAAKVKFVATSPEFELVGIADDSAEARKSFSG